MRKFLLIFIMVAALWMSCTMSVNAQESPPTGYDGLDVIFLIDQSGSMGGDQTLGSAHPDPNDPNGWRFEVLDRAIVQYLGPAMYQFTKDATLRVAVVEYGDVAQLAHENSAWWPDTVWPYVIEVDSVEDWQPMQQELSEILSAYREWRSKRHMGNTDHYEAFQVARDVFAQVDDASGTNRLHAIMLVTDGKPCIPAGEDRCQPFTGYLEKLVQDAADWFPPEENYYIYVIGINDSTDSYWPRTEEYWTDLANSHNGQAEKMSQVTQMSEFLVRHLGELVMKLSPPGIAREPIPPVPETISGGVYGVRPYLQSIDFYISKVTPDDWVKFIEIDQELSLETDAADDRVTVLGKGTLAEKVTVLRPRPGIWQLERSEGATIIQVQGTPYDPHLLSPTGPVPQGLPTEVEVRFYGDDGKAAPTYSDYDLLPEVVFERPDGQQDTITLSESDPGVFTGLYIPMVAGEHRVSLVASSHTPDGQVFKVTGTYPRKLEQVLDVRPVSANLVKSSDTYYQYHPFPIEIHLLDNQGQRIKDSAAPNLALNVYAQLSHEEQTPFEVPLERIENGIYRGNFMPFEAGIYTVDVVVQAPDLEGGTVTLMDAVNVGDIEVKSTSFTLVTSGRVYYQYRPVPLNVQWIDASGKQLQSLEGQHLPLIINLTLSNENEEVEVTLSNAGPGLYTGTFTPTNYGSHQVGLLVQTPEMDGTLLELVAQPDFGQIEIKKTTLIDFSISEPEPEAQQLTHHRLLWFVPKPLDIEIHLTDEQGSPVAAESISDVGQPFAISLVDPAGEDQSEALTLSKTNQPGVFRASPTDVDTVGSWTLEVRANASLKPDYMWGTSTQQRTFERQRFWPTLVGDILVLLIIVIVLGIIGYQAWKVRRPPLLTGTLTIRRIYEDAPLQVTGGTLSLTGRKRNHLVFKQGDLPALVHLKKLVVDVGPTDMIRVQAYRDNGIKLTKTLSHGSRAAIDGTFQFGYEKDLGI